MKSCMDRIDESFNSRNEMIAEYMNVLGDPNSSSELWYETAEDLDSIPLSISSIKITRVLFSTGGPEDYLDIYHDGPTIEKITYIFNDWFDYAEINVTADDNIFNYATFVLEGEIF